MKAIFLAYHVICIVVFPSCELIVLHSLTFSVFCLQELSVPLRTYTENFPNKKHLHPYERSLIELTLGDGNYEEVTTRS